MKRSSVNTRWWRAGSLIIAVVAGSAGTGCWNDVELPVNTGSLGGQVLISGGVRGARISADQLDLHTGEVRLHVGEAVSDATGRFEIFTGTENGIIRIRSRGGSFEDLATGATIDLDSSGTGSWISERTRS